MDYYLKKQKFLCIIVCVFQALSFTMNACIQFLLMKIFDSAAQMNFNLVLFWCCIDIFGWGLYLLFSVLADRIQAKAIWALNNDVRKNIYDSILSFPLSTLHFPLSTSQSFHDIGRRTLVH